MLNDLYTEKLLTACSNLYENNNLTIFSDIKISLENGEEIPGHKLILFSQSEIWSSDKLEKVDILDLSDIPQITSYSLVRWLYTNMISIDTDCQTLFQLLQQATRYKIPALQHKCEKMLTGLVNQDNCEIFYHTAVEISNTTLIDYCKKYYSQYIDSTKTLDNHQINSEDEPISIDVAQIVILDTVETDTNSSHNVANQLVDQSGSDEIATSQSGLVQPENKPYECDYCEKSYSKSQYLSDHIKIVHSSSKSFSCPHCLKTFTVNKSLKRHLNAHCTKILYTCDICGKSFKRKLALASHSKIHTVEPDKLKSSLSMINQDHREITLSVLQDEANHYDSQKQSREEFTMKENLSVAETTDSPASEIKVQIDSDPSQSMETSKTDIESECPVPDLQVKSEARKLTVLIRNPPSSKKRPYKCDVCNKAFTKSNHLKDHKTVHSKVREFRCEICASSFLTKNSLRQHLRTHSSEKPYKCHICSKSFVQNRDLQNHFLKNEDCKLGKQTSYEDNENSVNDENEWIPEKDFVIESETINDKNNQELNSDRKCPICQREFLNSAGLRVHRKTHTISVNCEITHNHDCQYCGKSFNSNHALVIHVRSHTGEKPFQCDSCPKAFRSASVLNGHKQTHIGIKPYKCDVCNKRFSKTNHVREHKLSIHSTERPYSCEICQKSFPTDKSLTVHVKTHNKGENTERYQCDICSKSFNQKSTLQKHLKHHIGNKDVMCDVCGKSFYDTADLNRHARVHVNEPHCDICDKIFCNAEYLQKHMLAHEGERRYACNQCDKSYFTKYNLTRHSKVCNKSNIMSE